MKPHSHGLADAVREHLLTGQPITRLEALIFFGVANLPDVVKELRHKGFVIQSRSVPFARALARVNESATLVPPANLPIREIQLTEYWVQK